jgi:hypothetical protein
LKVLSFLLLYYYYFLQSDVENDAVAIWKSLRGCDDLSLAALSDPKRSVTMPWPSTLVAQLDRMKLAEGKMDIVGREFFGELYRHTISERS